MYRLTIKGKEIAEHYIKELEAKRKEILDAGKDTCDETQLPTLYDIEDDIAYMIDKDGEYYNSWGVTDNYNADCPLYLSLGTDFADVWR